MADPSAAYIAGTHDSGPRLSVRPQAMFDRLWHPTPLCMIRSLLLGPNRFKGRFARFVRQRLQAPAATRAQAKPAAAAVDAPPTNTLLAQRLATDKNSSALRELIILMTLDALWNLQLKYHSPTLPLRT